MKKETMSVIRQALPFPEDALREKIELLLGGDYLSWVRAIELFVREEAFGWNYLAEKNTWTDKWIPSALNEGVPVLIDDFRGNDIGLQRILKMVEARATYLLPSRIRKRVR